MRIDEMTQHLHYLNCAAKVALNSPDPSTKIGAVLVYPAFSMFDQSDLDKAIVAMDCNDFPTGVLSTPERWNDRVVKYSFVVHAERRLLLNLLRTHTSRHTNTIPMERTTLYVHGLPPCGECAGDVITAGIRSVVYADLEHIPERQEAFRRWNNSSNTANLKFREAGVRVLAIRPDPKFVFDRKQNVVGESVE